MFIGELAKHCNVSVKALRLYEAMGLLSPVSRQGKYRVYSDIHLQQVLIIRRAQTLGFRLADMKKTFSNKEGMPDWEQVLRQLAQRAESVSSEIKRLETQQVELRKLCAELETCVAAQRETRMKIALTCA